MKKKHTKKHTKKQAAVKHEVVVKIQQSKVESLIPTPTVQELSEPMRDGRKLTIPKTWLSENQLTFLLQKTPRQHIYKRKGRGGKMFDYVIGSYVQKALNYAFGWAWDFEVVEHGKESNHVWVLGKLTVYGTKEGQKISKTQFGRSDVKQLREGGNVDYGNDLKAAATDSLKKCASLLGIASDVYGKADYLQETGVVPADIAPSTPVAPVVAHVPSENLVCHGATKAGCGNDITEAEYQYSTKLYQKPLCKDCQKLI